MLKGRKTLVVPWRGSRSGRLQGQKKAYFKGLGIEEGESLQLGRKDTRRGTKGAGRAAEGARVPSEKCEVNAHLKENRPLERVLLSQRPSPQQATSTANGHRIQKSLGW